MKPITRLVRRAQFPLSAFVILGVVCLAQNSPAQTPPPKPASRDAAKVLTIGNSFADNATEFLPQIVESTGRQLVLFRANLGGCSLERHARHLRAALANPDDPKGSPYANNAGVLGIAGKKKVSLPEALAAVEWDFVTIQEWSQRSFKPEHQEPHAKQLIDAIRKLAPTAEIVIHQTWAYREDHAWYQKGDGFTQQKMHAGLRAAYKELSARHGLRILPSGDAMQAARATPRWTYEPDKNFDFKNPPEGKLPGQKGSLNVGWRWRTKNGRRTFSLDAIHANTAGKYLTGCVFFEGLYGTDCARVRFVPEDLTGEDAADLRRIAHSVSLGKKPGGAKAGAGLAKP
ncbi:hypothetical protein M2103_001912 [Ereboglobus sp. PH5-5]|uniref:DUF4886 domain-containing protein n=1 Tax=unclassified Ereboglobus TaxID=2626932 RepID=UPI002406BEA0|nr:MULTISPECIES: DUF4886 domain-containing protein [unclassified Ereboglobus]MDF9828352.1 hypothetical protein [Ereboglobus sp. PH5-10]MDF9833680.1 hypothetical protein [Ereboglobus sp. PH5-5]